MNICVLGLGNLLMNDDAAGALTAKELQKEFDNSDNFKIIEGGTLGMDLLHFIQWSDYLIIIDSVQLDLDPGSVVKIEGKDIDYVFQNKLSPHQMGMKDILFASEISGDLPEKIVFYGIQVENIEMDMKLSAKVKANISKLKNEVIKEIECAKNSALEEKL
ncbi:HyaD/HybD family hydrogenase maturation endopeptidase [Flexistipes sinusarabici]|uniref:HyaD/HybD family hydrogenase maturation endopeptidase n=1 Tax=Flexistipes sinusarabici TaxID=2352 RepID=UPI002355B71A|nr:HyaD/HybD family hydrogenase maturation endopeptidase [Flexistipes sinusarabici]